MNPMATIKELESIALDLRVDILEMLHEARSGHPGGSLSSVELVVALYFHELRYRVGQPDWSARDRFLISKGHGVPTVYAALARAGCIGREELATLRKIESRLQGHPDHVRLPYVEAATGSLGQGLSVALGMAMASPLSADAFRVFCLLGDGELQAGQVWEAAMAAGKFETGNLTAIVDYNKVQLDGHVKSILDIEPLADKFAAFGWHVQEIDGHDMAAVLASYEAAGADARPSVVIAHTVKGKGVSFMEDTHAWHGKAPDADELERALAEVRGQAA